jgi:hypothetical protein
MRGRERIEDANLRAAVLRAQKKASWMPSSVGTSSSNAWRGQDRAIRRLTRADSVSAGSKGGLSLRLREERTREYRARRIGDAEGDRGRAADDAKIEKAVAEGLLQEIRT